MQPRYYILSLTCALALLSCDKSELKNGTSTPSGGTLEAGGETGGSSTGGTINFDVGQACADVNAKPLMGDPLPVITNG
ncbi:MAG: hypothetical protein VX223_13060 [Myxococcota bacterium]|nr:hypothetical protein [Myxococcota bacterium]